MEGDHFLLPILVREGDHNLLGGTVFGSQFWSGGLILAATFGPGGPLLGGTGFRVTGPRDYVRTVDRLQLRSNFCRKRMVCAGHTNLGLSTLLFMALTNHMLHTDCSNGAAIDCTVDFTSLRISVNISVGRGRC